MADVISTECPHCGSHDYGWDLCADCGYSPETNPYPDEDVVVDAFPILDVRADPVHGFNTILQTNKGDQDGA